MTNKHLLTAFCFTLIALVYSGCNNSTDTHSQLLDLSRITVTGPQGPDDFIGDIDSTDWDRSSYSAVRFGNSYWIQKNAVSDTLFFGVRSAGDTISQSLKLYNQDTANLFMTLQLVGPFFSRYDVVLIPPASLGTISISFALPDTITTIFDGSVILRSSRHDSVVLRLYGYRIQDGSGGVVSEGAPVSFRLAPAYPNPTDGEIRFGFNVPYAADALLQVVNESNELMATIAQGRFVAGAHSVSWNANLANGNYRVIFRAGNYTSHGDIRVWRQ